MKATFTSVLFLLFALAVFAQNDKEKNDKYKPVLNGVLKTKYEFDFNNSLSRFEVRNARFGAIGKLNDHFSYRAEIDLSDEGKIKMLDAWAKFSPTENLHFVMGQQKVPFSTDYQRNPAENFFANRSFVAKYVNSGLRDIGFSMQYKATLMVPIEIWVAALNGTGYNNPDWVKQPNFAGRLIIHPVKDFSIKGNVYTGELIGEKDLFMYGMEACYKTDKILIETEYISRHFDDTSAIPVEKFQDGLYIHSYYNFILNKETLKMISPKLRWDMMGDKFVMGNLQAARLTAGINFGFEMKPFVAEIRLDFEKYFRKSMSIHTDKITLEFVARF